MNFAHKKLTEHLIKKIEIAFADVSRPVITKSVARGYDDEWVLSDERIAELSNLDPEQKWTDVTENDVRFFQEYFTFSDAAGWKFYLPAHMSFYLRGFPDYGWNAVYTACTHSAPKFELLSPEQMSCVREFIDLIHEEERSRTSGYRQCDSSSL